MSKPRPTLPRKGPASESGDIVRTTVVLPTVLDRNLQVLSLTKGESKNFIITAALRKFVQDAGLRPDEEPKIAVSY